MEEANHCYEIEMTSNYLLAVNIPWLHTFANSYGSPLSLLCPSLLFVAALLMNGFRQLLLFFFSNVETLKIGVVKQSLVSHREQQLPAVGNQWSFLQINSIQLWSTVHCRFLDVGFWKLDSSDWKIESFTIKFFYTLSTFYLLCPRWSTRSF